MSFPDHLMAHIPLPSVDALIAFESAARHQSFTRAAAELNLSQGAISRQIRVLEDRLGSLLFPRVRQRGVLPRAGAALDDGRRQHKRAQSCGAPGGRDALAASPPSRLFYQTSRDIDQLCDPSVAV